ncbi:hypothetical protein LCGC14_3013120, partial [marine sediment metagenome]
AKFDSDLRLFKDELERTIQARMGSGPPPEMESGAEQKVGKYTVTSVSP